MCITAVANGLKLVVAPRASRALLPRMSSSPSRRSNLREAKVWDLFIGAVRVEGKLGVQGLAQRLVSILMDEAVAPVAPLAPAASRLVPSRPVLVYLPAAATVNPPSARMAV